MVGRGSLAAGGAGGGAVLGQGPTCTLDATLYDLRLPAEQIGRLDSDALTRAAETAAAFEKALGELGTAKPLYRINQAVRLESDYVQVGAQVPYVTNSQTDSRGQIINSVAYTSIGAIFNIAGKAAASGKIELDLGIQMSGFSEGATTISSTVKAPMFRTIQMAHRGFVTARQPFVVISADAASTDANGKAVAYIARVILGTPQSASSAAGGAAAPPPPAGR